MRTFTANRTKELWEIPDEYLRIFKDSDMVIAAKYMVQPYSLTYVLEHLVGAGHKGGRNKATIE